MNKSLPVGVRVLVLAGEEFQRLERLREVLESAVDPATRDFNLDNILSEEFRSEDGECPGLNRLYAVLAACPMMAARRVVVVRDLDGIHNEYRKKVFAAAAGTPDTTLLILEGEKLAVPKDFPRGILRVEDFNPLYENQLPGWVREQFAKRGRRIEPDAAAILVNNVGTVLGELDSEIEKVTVAATDDPIGAEDVSRVVGDFRQDTVFALCDAVGKGDFPGTVRVLEGLLAAEKGKEPSWLAMVGSHVLRIAAYNEALRRGVPHERAWNIVVLYKNMWKTKDMDRQVRRFTPARIRRTLTALARTDSLFKKHSIDRELMMGILAALIVPGRPVPGGPAVGNSDT